MIKRSYEICGVQVEAIKYYEASELFFSFISERDATEIRPRMLIWIRRFCKVRDRDEAVQRGGEAVDDKDALDQTRRK